MVATIDSLTRDFSWAVTHALQEYAAVRSGVPCPASVLKNAPSARQAFPGSVLRLRNGSVQVVDFTGGVKDSPVLSRHSSLMPVFFPSMVSAFPR